MKLGYVFHLAKWLIPLAAGTCAAVIYIAYSFHDPYRRMARHLTDGMMREPWKKVVVLPFVASDGRPSDYGTGVSENLVTCLYETGELKLMEVSLNEYALHRSRAFRGGSHLSQTSQRLGRSLGADIVITGTLQTAGGDKLRVNARAIDVESGSILAAAAGVVSKPPRSTMLKLTAKSSPGRQTPFQAGLTGRPPGSTRKVHVRIGPPIFTQTGADFPPPGTVSARPKRRNGGAAAIVNDKLFLIGGNLATQPSTGDLEVFDQLGDEKWTTHENASHGRTGAAAGLAGKLYFVGGCYNGDSNQVTSRLDEYDPATKRWKELRHMPTPRTGVAATVTGGKLYAVGGLSPNRKGALGTLEAYDPTTNNWEKLPEMPTPRHSPIAAAIAGKVYVAGGMLGRTSRGSDALEIYDPSTRSWSVGRRMPHRLGFAAGAAIAGKLYVVGGKTPAGKASDRVVEYDPGMNAWRERTHLPTPRWAPAVAALGDLLYVIGGSQSEEHHLDVMEVYIPRRNTW